MNGISSCLSLHFFICKMGLLIAPTSQDWYEESDEAMPGQLPAQCLARSGCSLNLSYGGPFQALSTPHGLGSGRSCSTVPPADSHRLAESPSTGALCLPGQAGGRPEGDGVASGKGRGCVWVAGVKCEPESCGEFSSNPVLLPTEISSVTAQAAEPRVSTAWGWGRGRGRGRGGAAPPWMGLSDPL